VSSGGRVDVGDVDVPAGAVVGVVVEARLPDAPAAQLETATTTAMRSAMDGRFRVTEGERTWLVRSPTITYV
jgi:hypothetical protein